MAHRGPENARRARRKAIAHLEGEVGAVKAIPMLEIEAWGTRRLDSTTLGPGWDRMQAFEIVSVGRLNFSDVGTGSFASLRMTTHYEL